jgi:hypothetical protein
VTALDRQVAETAERVTAGVGDVVLTVSAWAGTAGFGLLMGVVAWVVTR